MHRTLDCSRGGPGGRSSRDGKNVPAAGGAARRPGRRQAGAGIAAFYAADLAREQHEVAAVVEPRLPEDAPGEMVDSMRSLLNTPAVTAPSAGTEAPPGD